VKLIPEQERYLKTNYLLKREASWKLRIGLKIINNKIKLENEI
jgi:hypothetical protein